jgi:hypothetical protein
MVCGNKYLEVSMLKTKPYLSSQKMLEIPIFELMSLMEMKDQFLKLGMFWLGEGTQIKF